MKKIILLSVFAAIGLFFLPHSAKAACTGDQIPLRIITRNAAGTLVPEINYIVYEQKTNPDGDPYFGNSLASGKTDAGGQSDVICGDSSKYPYAVKLYETNETYGYFSVWSSHMSGDRLTSLTADVRMSSLNVIMRDAEGTVIKHANFDVYVQSFDINSQPIVDETKLDADKVILTDKTTGDYGARNLYLSAGYYVIRVHATGDRDYIYVWNQQVVTGAVTTTDYRIGTLRTILEDGYGGLIKSKDFSIYHQTTDVRGKAIMGELVAQDLNTGLAGGTDAYLPAGTYVVRVKASYGESYYYDWNNRVTNQELTTSTYKLSGFRIIIRNAAGAVVKNAEFAIGTQRTDATGQPALDNTIQSGISTGELGYKDIYLPPDTYVLVYGDKRLYGLDANENQFTKIDWPRTITVRPQSEVSLSNPVGNVNLTMRKRSTPTIKLTKFKTAISKAYTINATKIIKSYTVVFYYNDAQLKAKSTKADKVRIAFYNSSTKKWSYVGKNYPTQHKASVSLKSKGILVLVAVK